jgi:hypothetical protein
MNGSVAEFIAYVSKYKADFANTIVEAKPAEIDILRRYVNELMGFDLPPDYEEFLQLMGGAEPPISFTYEAHSEIAEVTEHHKWYLEDIDEMYPNSIFIACGGYPVEDVSLECLVVNGKTVSGRVFLDSLEDTVAESFIGHLYNQAFVFVSGHGLGLAATFVSAPPGFHRPVVEQAASYFGIKPLWFSDSINFCGMNDVGDLTLHAIQKPNKDGMWLKLCGRDRQHLMPYVTHLKNKTPLSLENWWRL